MSRNDNLIRTTIIYFIGNFASKMLGFVLLPLYTTYLTSEDYGTVDILISTVPLIAPIFTMQVTESVFRFLMMDKTIIERAKTITNSIFIFFVGILIFLISYFILLSNYKFDYGFLFSIYFITMYISIFFQQILRGLHRTVEYASIGVISTFLQAALNIYLIVYIGQNGEALLLSAIVGSIIISLYMAIRIQIWNYLNFNLLSSSEIIRQLKFGIPLIPNQIAWWGIALLGKFILLYYHNIADNGILAVANKFPSLITIVSSIFITAWTENVINEYNSKDRDIFFSATFSSFTKFIFTSAAVLLPLIKIYNVLTITGDFFDAWKYVPILIIGSSFNSLAAFLGTIYTASMNTIHAFTTTVIAALSNLVISIIMIPLFSIWGVVISNLVSFMVLYFVRIKSVRRFIKLDIEYRHIFPSIIVMMFSILVYYSFGLYFQYVSLLVFSIIFVYINRNMFNNLLNYVLKFKK